MALLEKGDSLSQSPKASAQSLSLPIYFEYLLSQKQRKDPIVGDLTDWNWTLAAAA
jgi:hypothetical protein